MVGSSVREALAEHLAASGLPPDAGDSDPFAVVRIFYLPYPIPNTRARKRAVRIHDLNHLVSGYQTDRIGELEISAWELASGGCRDYGAAWVLDLAGLLGGLVVAPRRTVRAFWAGRSQPAGKRAVAHSSAPSLGRHSPGRLRRARTSGCHCDVHCVVRAASRFA